MRPILRRPIDSRLFALVVLLLVLMASCLGHGVKIFGPGPGLGKVLSHKEIRDLFRQIDKAKAVSSKAAEPVVAKAPTLCDKLAETPSRVLSKKVAGSREGTELLLLKVRRTADGLRSLPPPVGTL